MSAHSIHHVTAVTAHIGDNLKFYTKTLGLRLVKRSVNQDDVSAYHLFYADAVGSPGTDMTFFDWPQAGPNIPGAATAALTSFRIPHGAVDFWVERLTQAGAGPLQEDGSILFADPEGQRLELVSAANLPNRAEPWAAEVPAEHALRGILGVDLNSARPDSTTRVLEDILGYRSTSPGVFETEGEGWGGRIRLVQDDPRRMGQVGAGGVHHVAFRVSDEDELLELEQKVRRAGLSTSGEVDRFYFKSVYFREPGGVLFELATEGPGFASDESVDHLGEGLALPPFLESRRASIEAGLKPLPSI